MEALALFGSNNRPTKNYPRTTLRLLPKKFAKQLVSISVFEKP
jgi:hypothetical protein